MKQPKAVFETPFSTNLVKPLNTHLPTPIANPPADLKAFWEQTLIELKQAPIAVERHHLEAGRDGILHEALHFPSLSQCEVVGHLLRWQDDNPRPLIVWTHGYEGSCDPSWAWAQRGFNVIGVDTRGFGRSRQSVDERHPDGYILTGIEEPKQSILRGAVCDFIRAAEVGQHLLPQSSSLIFYGYSFGGAMSLLAQAVTGSADLTIAGVPTFGWAEGRRRLVKGGSGLEINNFIQANPSKEQQIMHTLRYFDPMNLAPWLKGPVIIGAGLEDSIVPYETVTAITHQLVCDYEFYEYPYSHSDKDESQWQQFEDIWLNRAASGNLSAQS